MEFELISDEEFDNLPTDNERCFIEFEAINRRNLNRMINNDTNTEFDRVVRQQYMAAVSAVAHECGVPNISFDPDTDENTYQQFGRFSLAVQGEVARLRIRQRGERHPYSVMLTGATRTKIEHYISRIRDVVAKSDMDAGRKRDLNKKLDELVSELTGHRLSFAKSMAILAAVMATMGSVVTISADGPSAVAHIMQLIGEDKATEETAARRLAPPPKALPAPPKPGTFGRPPPRSLPDELDDDIPF